MENRTKPKASLGNRWNFRKKNQGFKAEFPGEPTSGINSIWYFIYSKYDDHEYEIHTHINERYTIPKTKKEFLKILKEDLPSTDIATVLDSVDESVRYAAEVKCYHDASHEKLKKVFRVYWTSDKRVYYAIVQGDDLTLAKKFFKKIHFN